MRSSPELRSRDRDVVRLEGRKESVEFPLWGMA